MRIPSISRVMAIIIKSCPGQWAASGEFVRNMEWGQACCNERLSADNGLLTRNHRLVNCNTASDSGHQQPAHAQREIPTMSIRLHWPSQRITCDTWQYVTCASVTIVRNYRRWRGSYHPARSSSGTWPSSSGYDDQNVSILNSNSSPLVNFNQRAHDPANRNAAWAGSDQSPPSSLWPLEPDPGPRCPWWTCHQNPDSRRLTQTQSGAGSGEWRECCHLYWDSETPAPSSAGQTN